MSLLNYSLACERNKTAITDQLKRHFAQCRKVLEIGSGSGQHVLHFAEHLPDISWQPMDLEDYFPALTYNLTQQPQPTANILPAKPLDLSLVPWVPEVNFDGLFSANTLHIMPWQQVTGFFQCAGQQLGKGGILCIYGPFKYNGEFTSPSNAEFELWLHSRDPLSGIRDFEAVNQQARDNGFSLLHDTPMPANNQLLVWQR
jgi:cyclopropane fatty-acyl-phospholipid synthase-like methyltransferase